MKKQNLLFVTLVIPMLASCGAKSGIKKPHNSVELGEFITKFSEKVENNKLFGTVENQDAFSFEVNRKSETNITFDYLSVSGKHLYTEKEKDTETMSTRFDSKKHFLQVIESISLESIAPEEALLETYKYEYIIESQLNINLSIINPNKHTYSNNPTTNSDKVLDSIVLELLGSTISTFEDACDVSKDIKYYVDKNVFTIVYEENETEDDISYAAKGVYQLAINRNSYSLVTKETLTDIDEEREKHVESYSTTKFNKKNVSVKHVNTSDFDETRDPYDFF